MRSVEFSLERLGVDRIDILYAHDLDIFTHGSQAAMEARLDEFMRSGLFRAAVAARPGRDQGFRRRHQRVASRRNGWPSAAISTCSCWPAATRCSSRSRWRASCRSARSAASASCSAAPTIPAFWRPGRSPAPTTTIRRPRRRSSTRSRASRRSARPWRQAGRGGAAVSAAAPERRFGHSRRPERRAGAQPTAPSSTPDPAAACGAI